MPPRIPFEPSVTAKELMYSTSFPEARTTTNIKSVVGSTLKY